MSHCEENGKDRVIFLTESDSKPEDSTVSLGPAEPSRPGLITESGEINWSCPCLGGMPVGPCGIEFRTAFECFHYRYNSSLLEFENSRKKIIKTTGTFLVLRHV